MVICIGNPYFMTEITKTFETADITDQLRQLSLSDISRLSEEKKTELLTAINSKLETLKKDKKNGNIAKAGTELRQILYDVRRLDLQKLIEKSETVQEVKSQLAALESVENSLNTSDKAREAMWKMKISDDSPEGIDMQPGEIINAQKWWDISKALNGLDLSTATSEQLPALLNIIENISNTRYDLVYKEGWKIDSIAKEEGGPEKYLNIYSEFKNTFARLRNEADTNALKAIDLGGVQNDPNIGDKVAAQGLDTIQYDYQLKEGVLTRTNKTSKITDYRNDVANIWETSQERDARLTQEKIKEEEPGKIADIIAGEHATGDSIDASQHWLDPAYSYTRTENSITRTRDGKTDTWDTDGKKWNTEADEATLLTQENEKKEGTNEYKTKIREIFEEMKSNPDVYSESDIWKETYEFNGQQLSLEWEEPNQYLTRVVDGKKQIWSSESEEWEEVIEVNYNPERLAFISSIGETPLPEWEWTRIGDSVYFRDKENLIAIVPGGDLRMNVDGKWQNIEDFSALPKEIQESATNARLEYFENNFGDQSDWEMWSGTTQKLRDIPLKNISRFDDFNAWNEWSTLAAIPVIKMVQWLLKSKRSEAPKMWELTLTEYNQYKKDPDSFAKSDRFLWEQRLQKWQRIVTENVGFVDPNLYWVESNGREYARYGKLTLSRPSDKAKQWDPANLAITIDWTTKSAYEFVMSSDAPIGMNQMIPWTQIPYSKYPNGDMQLWDKQYIAGVSNPGWTKKVG